MFAKSAAFIEDIPMVENHNETYHDMLNNGFKQSATNCFGAVALYGGCLVFCLIQVFFNVKLSQLKQIK